MSISLVPPELLPYLLGTKVDNSSLADSIFRINITFIVLVTITTCLRLWVRVRMLRNVGLDDVFMIFAFLFAILLSVSCLIAIQYGLGKHLWNLSPNILEIPKYTARVTKALYGCYLSYSLAIALVKFSIIATYLRIFSEPILRKVIWVIVALVMGLLICNIFAIIFTCVPVEAAWKYDIKGKCFPIVNFFYASSAINIATDVALCILPIPTLWALSMPKSQRVVLCILFALGAFTCVASILRLRTLSSTGPVSALDFSYNTVTSINWCVIEVGTALTCASLSSLRPLLARLLPKIFSHVTNPSYQYRNTPKIHPPSRSGATKLASANQSHTRSQSAAWGSRSKNRDNETERGEIVVEQSFQMREEWEMTSKDGPQLKTLEKSKEGVGRIYGKARGPYDGSSEEELVIQGRILPVAKGR